jgi:hypothetical protein
MVFDDKDDELIYSNEYTQLLIDDILNDDEIIYESVNYYLRVYFV